MGSVYIPPTRKQMNSGIMPIGTPPTLRQIRMGIVPNNKPYTIKERYLIKKWGFGLQTANILEKEYLDKIKKEKEEKISNLL